MSHLVLLGDSIFDNGAYTEGGPDVVSQVRRVLPPGWKATLLAVDGDTTDGIARQLEKLPGDATHLALSVGGNDALMQIGVLDVKAETTAEGIANIGNAVAVFEGEYRAAVRACLERGLPLTLCTIYNGYFPDPGYRRAIDTTIAIFDDAIIRTALAYGLPIVDLRSVCCKAEDYANPIEPSSIGGAKIARTIVELVTRAASRSPTSLLRGL